MYLAPVETAHAAYICLTVFDEESSLGLVRIYFDELCKDLAAAAPPLVALRPPTLAVDFERDLNANLAAMFGRDPGHGPRDAARGSAAK